MTLTWVAVLLLTQVPGAEEPAKGAWPSASSAAAVLSADTPSMAAREGGRWNSLLRLEASMLVLLPRGGRGEPVGYAQLSLALAVEGGGA
jgi:hypothetical protein